MNNQPSAEDLLKRAMDLLNDKDVLFDAGLLHDLSMLENDVIAFNLASREVSAAVTPLSWINVDHFTQWLQDSQDIPDDRMGQMTYTNNEFLELIDDYNKHAIPLPAYTLTQSKESVARKYNYPSWEVFERECMGKETMLTFMEEAAQLFMSSNRDAKP